MKRFKHNFRWKAYAVAFAMALFGVAFASMEDKVLRFSTPGTDRYADGSVVVDGECYALVWSPAGTTFSGFNADGTPVSANDRVVLAAPLALNGKCRDAIFQVPAAEYAELQGGEWAVCLVDTRNIYGVPAGAQDGKPVRVNRWGLVKSGVKVEPASVTSQTFAAPAMVQSSSGPGPRLGATGPNETGGGVRADTRSEVPDSAPSPQITAIEVTDGEVWLAVDGTVPYLDYTIVSGAEPGDLRTDYFSEIVEGDDSGEIAIGTVKSVKRRFFKIVRAE